MATSTGATPAYLLAPEVSALFYYMPDQRHHMLFATMWNTGIRIGEARTLTLESFELDGLRPFVRVLSEKVRARRGCPPKDEVRLVPLTDISYIMHMLYHRQPRKVIQALAGALHGGVYPGIRAGYGRHTGRAVHR